LRHSNLVKNNLIITGVNVLDKLLNFQNVIRVENLIVLFSQTKYGYKKHGLRNIEVADTKISYIDGQKGKLIYRGYDILDLTKNSNFEETCFLLLHDKLPTKNEFDDFRSD